ncbi:MAG: LytR/AlgR family response regulator transcription factor [Nitrospinota bacterium]
MKILIVEDEPPAARKLTNDIKTVAAEQVSQIITCSNIESARELLADKFDLLFLDLNIEGEFGFDILREFATGEFKTIIVTAYDQFALEAFELGAFDYIVKPVTIERLEKSFQRLNSTTTQNREKLKSLLVKTRGRYEKIPIERIIAVKSAGDYSELYLDDGKVKLSSKRMEFLENNLPDQFFRTHRSCIIKLDNISRIEPTTGGKYSLSVDGIKEPLPVGRSKYQSLLKLLETKKK